MHVHIHASISPMNWRGARLSDNGLIRCNRIGNNNTEVITMLLEWIFIAALVPLPVYCAIKSWNEKKEVFDVEFTKTESHIQRQLLKALRNNGRYPSENTA